MTSSKGHFDIKTLGFELKFSRVYPSANENEAIAAKGFH
jgi:hypothetical protein